MIPQVVVDLNGARRMTTENDVIGIATEGLDVLVYPVKRLVNIQDVEVLLFSGV